MKKKIISSVLLATMVFSTASAFAADKELPVTTISAPAADEVIVGAVQITVDKEKVDLEKLNLTQYMYTENENTLVPLRAVAEKMGYSVAWDEADEAVTVSDDEWKVVLNIGADSYYGVTKIKDAVGMTGPQSYGAAPRLIEDTTFVPAKMFELMGYTFSAVGQYASFTKAGADDSDAAQIPNPLVSYDSIDDAAKVLGFKPNTPSYIPAGFNCEDISTIGNELLQVIYTDKDGSRISYRTAKGDEDISGDYTTYSVNKEVNVNGMAVVLHGNDKIAGATWTNNGFSYAVLTDKEVDEADMIKFVSEIK